VPFGGGDPTTGGGVVVVLVGAAMPGGGPGGDVEGAVVALEVVFCGTASGLLHALTGGFLLPLGLPDLCRKEGRIR
jgi:hypothetical protein